MANVQLSDLGSVIKAAYEGESNTNAFTDSQESKLAGIESGADVTDATNVAAAGAFITSTGDTDDITEGDAKFVTAAQKTKIDGIESGAEVNVVDSNTAGITGADQITNIVSLTQSEFDAIVSPLSTTLYIITD